jgi:hypothetical protein
VSSGRASGPAGAEAKRQRLFVGAHRSLQALKPLRRLAARHQQQEFLAAPARQQIGAAQGLAGQFSQAPEHGVADGVAMLVVDQLEAIEVDEGQRQRLAQAPQARQRGVQGLLGVAAVGQIGQGIARGQALDLGQRLLQAQALALESLAHRTHLQAQQTDARDAQQQRAQVQQLAAAVEAQRPPAPADAGGQQEAGQRPGHQTQDAATLEAEHAKRQQQHHRTDDQRAVAVQQQVMQRPDQQHQRRLRAQQHGFGKAL